MANEYGETPENEQDAVVPPRPGAAPADPYSVPRPGPSLNTPPAFPGATPPPPPQPRPYGVQGGWNEAPAYRPNSGLAVAGFVVSLASLIVPIGVVGLVLSIVGLVQVTRRNLGGKALAIIGIVVGAITTLVGGIIILGLLAAGISCANNPNAYTDSSGTYHCGTSGEYGNYKDYDSNSGELTVYGLR
jgi:hypothetical protein